jgi:hypothetical protein
MSLTLLDWRRRVARLYEEVRGEPDIVAAHDHWRRTRDDLLRTHPDSPIPQPQRAGYPGAPVAAYDPQLRFHVLVDTDVPPRHMELPTGSDGIVPFDRIGIAHLPRYGDLDVWWLGSYGGGVFVPVKDASAGVTTYGGGRYLIDTVKGADLGGDDGRLQLRLQPVVCLRSGLGVPAGYRGQHPQPPAAGRRTCAVIAGQRGSAGMKPARPAARLI